jgi:hypothetical protein
VRDASRDGCTHTKRTRATHRDARWLRGGNALRAHGRQRPSRVCGRRGLRVLACVGAVLATRVCRAQLLTYTSLCPPAHSLSLSAAAWGEDKVAKEDLEQWASEWDDDNLETGFDKYLAAELAKTAAASGAGAGAASGAPSS